MNEPSRVLHRVGFLALTMDGALPRCEHQDVCSSSIIIFRFFQAGSEVSARWVACRPRGLSAHLWHRVGESKSASPPPICRLLNIDSGCVCACDDLTDPAPRTNFAHLEATTVTEPVVWPPKASTRLWISSIPPSNDASAASSGAMDHYRTARQWQILQQRYKDSGYIAHSWSD